MIEKSAGYIKKPDISPAREEECTPEEITMVWGLCVSGEFSGNHIDASV